QNGKIRPAVTADGVQLQRRSRRSGVSKLISHVVGGSQHTRAPRDDQVCEQLIDRTSGGVKAAATPMAQGKGRRRVHRWRQEMANRQALPGGNIHGGLVSPVSRHEWGLRTSAWFAARSETDWIAGYSG